MSAAGLAFALAACGEDVSGTIPEDLGEPMLSQLDAVEERVDAGDCEGATRAAQDLLEQVAALPADSVETDVRKALSEASGRLVEQTQDSDQCKEDEPDTTTSTTESSTTEPTTTSTSESTTEPTTTEKSTTEETTTTETETDTTTTQDTTTGSTTTGGGSGGIGTED